ncbi:MAG: SMP-30/gluconolactonase/LRE family protein [Acidobacteria bacterium]|nr:SMP-30/gluconolactonase/LRE family protein [Acidobacteriota bacterium]
MRRRGLGAVLLTLLIAGVRVAGEAGAEGEAVGLEAAAFLAGSWGQGGEAIEVWLPPAAGLMVGVNRPLVQKEKPFFEFLRIEEREGTLVYLAAPRGRGETAFRLTSHGEGSLVFENPEHDFPQRIAYRLEGDLLVAEAQAKREGTWQGISYRWQRIGSPAEASAAEGAGEKEGELQFPVRAELVTAAFGGSEGLAFNGEGKLFVTANRALWQVYPDGAVRQVVELDSNLGLAPIGEKDLLVADFGPTNAFRQDRNDDGVVWRITPEGEKTALVTGLGDPNFILLRQDGSMLISDDATADIYLAGQDGSLRLFSTAVSHPNGLALSADGRTLYVAQIFKSIRPVVPDDSLWALPLGEDGFPSGAAERVARLGPYAANDGLAMDREGRVYVAANGKAGEIWRYDPGTKELVLVARDVPGAASIAFGEGDFDPRSIYVSTTFNGGLGGKIWRIPVGVTGQPLVRIPDSPARPAS